MRPGTPERETPATLPARRLRPHERLALALEIVGSYVRVARVLRGAPIETTIARMRGLTERDESPATAAPASTWEAHRLANAVTRTLAPLPGDTRCLVRSLVLTRLLARRGIASTLVIGARTTPAFLAHAWVELGGVPVLDSGGGEFAPLVEL